MGNERQKVLVKYELFGEQFDFDFLGDFIKHVNEIWKEIPKNMRGEVQLDLETYNDYDCYRPKGHAYYFREETDEEMNKRLDKLATIAEIKEAEERELYLKLKKKYGEK